MATRSRLIWKPDSRGYFTRQIGWELSKTGKLQQHKFLLGTDRGEAEYRERKLRELWDQFERSSENQRPMWPDALLEIASRIAKGISSIPVPRAAHEKQHHYAARIQRMQVKYPVICFVPQDQHAYQVGQSALELVESIPALTTELKIEPPDVDDINLVNELLRKLKKPALILAPSFSDTPYIPVGDRTNLDSLGVATHRGKMFRLAADSFSRDHLVDDGFSDRSR